MYHLLKQNFQQEWQLRINRMRNWAECKLLSKFKILRRYTSHLVERYILNFVYYTRNIKFLPWADISQQPMTTLTTNGGNNIITAAETEKNENFVYDGIVQQTGVLCQGETTEIRVSYGICVRFFLMHKAMYLHTRATACDYWLIFPTNRSVELPLNFYTKSVCTTGSSPRNVQITSLTWAINRRSLNVMHSTVRLT